MFSVVSVSLSVISSIHGDCVCVEGGKFPM